MGLHVPGCTGPVVPWGQRLGAVGTPWGIRVGSGNQCPSHHPREEQGSQGAPGAAPALGNGQLPGDGDGLRPGWDEGLRVGSGSGPVRVPRVWVSRMRLELNSRGSASISSHRKGVGPGWGPQFCSTVWEPLSQISKGRGPLSAALSLRWLQPQQPDHQEGGCSQGPDTKYGCPGSVDRVEVHLTLVWITVQWLSVVMLYR